MMPPPPHAGALAASLVTGLGAGFALGVVHFATLARNLRLFAAGRLAAAFGLQFVRLAVTIACFAVLARQCGAGAVLAGLAGLLLARTWLLRRTGAGP
ncbi:ATP synthase subunit I [Polaromonas sp. C04]|uniref:N-ATPase subunit AtpR n=1 Tax=Polaromonas sp. C04 TaxID=1945857 RepID=UPI0009868E7D|nr:ATP synthase subunit I [Polaromonas sp. C04]